MKQRLFSSARSFLRAIDTYTLRALNAPEALSSRRRTRA